MITIVTSDNNDKALAYLRSVATDASETWPDPEQPGELVIPPLEDQTVLCLLPETGRPVAEQFGYADKIADLAKTRGMVLLWTMSRPLFFRLCRRIAEGSFPYQEAKVVWCGGEEPQVFTFLESGLCEGVSPETPMPFLFGEKEVDEEYLALRQAVHSHLVKDNPVVQLKKETINVPVGPS